MNKLSKERQTQIISALVEGNSLRAVARMCHADVHTVQWLLEDVGRVCAEYQAQTAGASFLAPAKFTHYRLLKRIPPKDRTVI